MRRILVLLCTFATVQAGVVSRDWNVGKLTLQLDDGTAELEWLGSVVFRFSRSWSNAVPHAAALAHESVAVKFEDAGPAMSMRTKYLGVDLDRGEVRLHIHAGDKPVTDLATSRGAGGAELRIALQPEERIFGLMGPSTTSLNLRGQRLERDHGYLFTSAGYGIFVRSPASCVFDLNRGVVEATGANSIDFLFYYGPAAKEVLEQHTTFLPRSEVKAESLDVLEPARVPKNATRLPEQPIGSWQGLAALVRTMLDWSLSGVAYPALDLSIFDRAPAAIRQRAADLSALFPILYRRSGEGGIDVGTRRVWTPYLTTYLREAFDRGYPLIRPLPMQFSKDAALDSQTAEFMLGDEVLLAPMVEPGNRRPVGLPRGNWTDLRTNIEYPGNQTVEVDAPPGRMPIFVRNGWIVPLAIADRMELHYFPSLGAEFFLWEPELLENSQFHAAPAGDFVRVEIESLRGRTYEWILHHTPAPHEVAEDSGAYTQVDRREQLRPNTWWHDAARNNLHLMLRAEARTDRIVNISH